MKQLYYNHPEYKILSVNDAYAHLYDEFLEFCDELTWDEFSDVCFAFNRLMGAVVHRKYVCILPFDGAHISKCNRRFLEYGHFRSKRHLSVNR